MARELQLYQGAVPQEAQVRVQAPAAVPQTPLVGDALDAAINRGLDVVDKFTRLKDFGTGQQVELQQARLKEEMQQEFQQRSQLPWGAEGSFYTEGGQRNMDELGAFTQKWRERNDAIARPFMRRDSAMQAEEARQRANLDIDLGVSRLALQQELENNKQAFNDNYDLAVAQGDYGRAVDVLNRAVADGQITATRGEVMKLKLARSQARSQGAEARSVNMGGVEYSGASAALAAQAMRDGSFAAFSDEDGDTVAGGDTAAVGDGGAGGGSGELPLTLGGASGLLEEVEPVKADVTRVGVEGAPDEKEGKPLALGGGEPLAAAGDGSVSLRGTARDASPADAWFGDGDMSGLCRVMPQSEFSALQDVLSFDGAITLSERPDGGVDFSCSPTAPAAVQRAAAHAQQSGEIGADDAKAMVARMTMDALEANPQESTDHLVEMYKDSGLYQVFGQGDAEVGKVRLRAVVEEYAQRMQAGSGKLQMKAVERMVDARLAEPDFGKGREWRMMEGLNPGVKKGEAWDKSRLSDRNKERWFALFEVYRKYRDEFNPQHKEGGADKDEFEPLAQDFYDWYMGRSHKYQDMKKRDTEAARDWFLAHVAEGLLDRLQVGKDGEAVYQGYAADVEVARERLLATVPFDLGQDALAELDKQRQRADAKRSAMFRKRAKEDYARLRGMKQAFSENSEKSQREKKRAEEKGRREQEKAEEKERKAQEQLAARKLAVARRQPRQQVWAWDRKPSADGECPACTVPEEEYRRLVEELGWDGSQDVYLHVAGASIQVVGANRRGRLELNAPAVFKVQKRPNARRGEKWKLQGDLGYSYIFRTYAN